MIKEITFEEIRYYWKKYLWSKYTNPIKKVDVTTQKNYCYRVIDYMNIHQIEKFLKATYIGYFIDNKIVGVESGYKTNIDYYRVRGLWVDKNYRRKGIATELIKWLESRSKEKYIWTCPRESALSFYLRYGFKISGLSEKTIYGQNYFAIKYINNIDCKL